MGNHETVKALGAAFGAALAEGCCPTADRDTKDCAANCCEDILSAMCTACGIDTKTGPVRLGASENASGDHLKMMVHPETVKAMDLKGFDWGRAWSFIQQIMPFVIALLSEGPVKPQPMPMPTANQ